MSLVSLKAEDIDVCMIAFNEEAFIEQCLLSLKPWFENLVVLDMESSDRTLEIVRDVYGDNVIIFSQPRKELLYKGFAYSRNRIADLACRRWVLHIDSDEILQPLDGSCITFDSVDGFGLAAKIGRRNLADPAPADFASKTLSQHQISSYEQHVRLYQKNSDTRWQGFLHEEVWVRDRPAGCSATATNLVVDHVSSFKSLEERREKERFYCWILVQVYDNRELQVGMNDYYMKEFIPPKIQHFRELARLYADKHGL